MTAEQITADLVASLNNDLADRNPVWIKAQCHLTSCSVKELKKQQIYLNNVLPDHLFISIINSYNWSDYYIAFPSWTNDRSLLIEYVALTETLLLAEPRVVRGREVNIKSLVTKNIVKKLLKNKTA